MKGKFLFGLAAAALAAGTPAQGQQHGPLGHYTARLSAQDHYNSNGQRLTTAAAIIRQDRANVHRFGVADPEDETDDFFDSADMRASLERLLSKGRITPAASKAIVNGTPLIHVDIYRGYIVVSIL